MAPVTRERIVRVATTIVESDGVAALSMRRLAAELGVTAMALYRHVDGRDGLLVAVLDEIAAGLVRPRLPADPVERVVVALVDLRGFLLRYPWVLRLIVGGHWSSLRGLWFTDVVLAAALDAGLDEAAAVATWTSVWQMTVGEVEFETARRAGPPGPGWAAALERGGADGPDGDLPALRALLPRWGELAAPFEARTRRVATALLRP